MSDILLTLQDLSKYYTTDQSVTVGLSHIDLAFRRGEFVAVTGESGSGKSTLAHVLGGILRYEGGELLFAGKPTSHYDSADWERYRRDKVSFISQSYGILPGSSVLDNVTCALRLVGTSREQAAKDAEAILKKVELWDLRRRRAAKLSSGQKQRLSIARALAKPAPVLIADEPTGNLDAENSAMVIALLAEAARDRLVILITHEFSEAEDYVTRHIVLHDGRVTADTQLREVSEVSPARTEGKQANTRDRKGLSWFVARFQIKARPVWAALMLCLFAFTVFAMFAFSGTFISNLDDTFTYYYDNSAFRNGDTRRIVVGKLEGGAFTDEDVTRLLGVRYVDSVEEYGCVTDIQYAYREGVDYTVKTVLQDVGSGLAPTYDINSSYSVLGTQSNMPFVRTIPAMADGKAFLTAGRLPENLYEVVAAGGEEKLGEKLTVLLQDQKNWSTDVFIRMEVTVVGVTAHGSHLYFHEDLGRMMQMNVQEDLHMLYMPLPENAVIAESEGTWSDGFSVYKLVSGGTITTEEGLSGTVRQKAEEYIMLAITDLDSFVTNFSLQGEALVRLSNLNNLAVYAEKFEQDGELYGVLEEFGLAYYQLFEMNEDSSVWRAYAKYKLEDAEVTALLNSIAEPLFARFKETYERERDALLELDLSQLSMEELDELYSFWGGGTLAGTEKNMNAKPIQPGEVVLSDAMLNTLTGETNRGKPKLTTIEQWAEAEEKANHFVYRFPALETSGAPTRELTVVATTELENYQVVLLHPEDFDAMMPSGLGDQVTVYAEDYAYVDRVLDAIHDLGYAALSPYQEGAVKQNEELAEQRMQTLRVCLIALLAVVVLQILLLRAMFSMETESYRLLSHIGLNCVVAQRSVFWQIMLFALGGQLLGVGIIIPLAAGRVDQVVTILRYLPLSYRIVLCLVHLGTSAFTAVWTMRALKKQVFPESGAAPDLNWDSLGEEVEV